MADVEREVLFLLRLEIRRHPFGIGPVEHGAEQLGAQPFALGDRIDAQHRQVPVRLGGVAFVDLGEQRQATAPVAAGHQQARHTCLQRCFTSARAGHLARRHPQRRAHHTGAGHCHPGLTQRHGVGSEGTEDTGEHLVLVLAIAGEEAEQRVGPERPAEHGQHFGPLGRLHPAQRYVGESLVDAGARFLR